MKVKVLSKFNDLKAGKTREAGEVFEVTNERFREINGTSHGVLVDKLKENNKIKSEAKKDEQSI